MINIGVIGYGYWGPNLVRNFNETVGGVHALQSHVTPRAGDANFIPSRRRSNGVTSIRSPFGAVGGNEKIKCFKGPQAIR